MSEKKSVGCLLLHGFTGSPFEMAPLAVTFQREGYVVETPVLPGHCKTVEEMDRTGFDDWFGAAEAAYLDLSRQVRKVFVIGLSMGGSLSLRLAQVHKPAGVIAIATPVYLYSFFPLAMKDWRLPFVPVFRYVRSPWPCSSPKPVSRGIAPWEGYAEAIPLHALSSLMQGLRSVRRELSRVTSPLTVFHSPKDRTVPVGNAYEIYGKVSSPSKKLEILPIRERVTGHHVLTTHIETRRSVADLSLAFIAGQTQAL